MRGLLRSSCHVHQEQKFFSAICDLLFEAEAMKESLSSSPAKQS
jgi:hypothetical protein